MSAHSRDGTVPSPAGNRSPTGWPTDHGPWAHAVPRRATVHRAGSAVPGVLQAPHDRFENVRPVVDSAGRQQRWFERTATGR